MSLEDINELQVELQDVTDAQEHGEEETTSPGEKNARKNTPMFSPKGRVARCGR